MAVARPGGLEAGFSSVQVFPSHAHVSPRKVWEKSPTAPLKRRSLLASAKQRPPAQEDPPLQTSHALPPAPHALFAVPGLHVPPEQHPEHEVLSQLHTPLAQ